MKIYVEKEREKEEKEYIRHTSERRDMLHSEPAFECMEYAV